MDAFAHSHSRFGASWTIARPAGTIDRSALDAITIELHLLAFEIFNWYFGIKMLFLFLTNEPEKSGSDQREKTRRRPSDNRPLIV
ncbi:MAG: hypothetical protein WAU59_07605 [Rhodoplanes sp.]